jgi:hypothetical protein
VPLRIPRPILSGFLISAISYFPFCSHRYVSHYKVIADLHIIFNLVYPLLSELRPSFSSRPFLYENLICMFREPLSFGEYAPFADK